MLDSRPQFLWSGRNELLQNSVKLFAATALLVFPATILFLGKIAGFFALVAVVTGLIILVTARKEISPFSRDEIRLFLAVSLLFFTAVITSWHNSTDLERANRFPNFIMIIFLFAFFRLSMANQRYFWFGLVAGSAANLMYAIYQIVWLEMFRASGTVTAILFGNVGLILGVMALAGAGWYREQSRWMVVLPVLALACGIATSVLSLSRGGWVALPVLGLALAWYAQRFMPRKAVVTLIVLAMVVLTLIYLVPETGVQDRIMRSLQDMAAYFRGDYRIDGAGVSSTSARFEMWKAAWLIFQNNPMLGVGWGNYIVETEKLVQQGIVNPEVSGFYHAHNQYLSALAKGGLLGFIALMILLFYPLAMLFKYTGRSYSVAVNRLAMAGFVFVLGFILFCLTEAMLEKSRTIIVYGFYLAATTGLIRNQLEMERRGVNESTTTGKTATTKALHN